MEKKELKTLIILFKAQASLSNSVKKSLEDTGLNLNEFVTMEALYTKKRLTTQNLAELLLIPNSSLTYVLDILMKKNYLKREKCTKDKRVQYVMLTKEGTEYFEKVYDKHYRYIRSIFDVVTEEEELVVQEILKKIGKQAQRRNET
ncbi:MAG: MarR family transcriptional regulator [Erysipelothrix sp.]|nr:MarR family transcriptional regulator [Erysipelothrix sp.]